MFGYLASLTPITNLLTLGPEIIKAAGDIVDSYSKIKREGIPALFKDVDKIFDDGVPEKLKKHLEIIKSNKDIMIDRLDTFMIQTEGIWKIMSDADLSCFDPKQISITSIPRMDMTELIESKQFETIVEEKNKQLDDNYNSFTELIHSELSETLHVVYLLLCRFNSGLGDLHGLVKNIEGIAKDADIPIACWDDQFFKDIYYNIRDARKELEKYVNSLDGITEILRVADSKINEVLIAIKPYIKNAIFNDKNYQNIIVYNLASYKIYKSAHVTFKDIEYQLSDNESEAIHILSDNAKLLKTDMKFLMNQIKKGTIH